MLTTSTVIGKSCQRTIIFTIELTRGQASSAAFMNDNIIAGLVYEYTNVEPMVVQTLGAKATMLAFPEGEEVDKICSTLQSIEMWLGHSVKIGCDIATSMQVSIGIDYDEHGEMKSYHGKM